MGSSARLIGLAVGVIAFTGLSGVAVAAPADEKADVDQRLESAQRRLQRERARERVLTDDVAGYTRRIRALEARLAPLRARSDRL